MDRSAADRRYWEQRRNHPDAQFLRTEQWKKIRLMQLGRQPLCEDCLLLGVTTKGEEVDHVQVPNGDVRLQRDLANLRTLCKNHHSMKTRADQRAGDRKRIIGYNAESGFPIYAPAKGQ